MDKSFVTCIKTDADPAERYFFEDFEDALDLAEQAILMTRGSVPNGFREVPDWSGANKQGQWIRVYISEIRGETHHKITQQEILARYRMLLKGVVQGLRKEYPMKNELAPELKKYGFTYKDLNSLGFYQCDLYNDCEVR